MNSYYNDNKALEKCLTNQMLNIILNINNGC